MSGHGADNSGSSTSAVGGNREPAAGDREAMKRKAAHTCPAGAETNQPRATPWVVDEPRPMPSALKGRNNHGDRLMTAWCFALSGQCNRVDATSSRFRFPFSPRAMPWAGLSCPFRANRRTQRPASSLRPSTGIAVGIPCGVDSRVRDWPARRAGIGGSTGGWHSVIDILRMTPLIQRNRSLVE